MASQYLCPYCHSRLVYVPVNQRWWCDQCRRYVAPQQIIVKASYAPARKKMLSRKHIIGIVCIILIVSIGLYWPLSQWHPPPIILKPPMLSVTYSAPSQAYLGYDWHISLSVTNNGGKAHVLIKYEALGGESNIDDDLVEGGSRNYDFLGYSDEVGMYPYRFYISAENDQGHDSKTVSFSVTISQEPVTIYYDHQEYVQKSEQITQVIALVQMGYFGGLFATQHIVYGDNFFQSPYYASVAWFVEPGSKSVVNMANYLSPRHSNTVLKAKELYYFVRDYIIYDYDKAKQGGEAGVGLYFLFSGKAWDQYPVLTLAWEKGVCVDKAILLASLLEASGLDACIVICSVQSTTPNHAYVLVHISYNGIHLNLAGTCKGYSWNEWLCLDPTDSSALFGQQAFSTGETVNAVVDVG